MTRVLGNLGGLEERPRRVVGIKKGSPLGVRRKRETVYHSSVNLVGFMRLTASLVSGTIEGKRSMEINKCRIDGSDLIEVMDFGTQYVSDFVDDPKDGETSSLR